MHAAMFCFQTDAGSPSQLQAYAARSLDLLRQIERIVLRLSNEARSLQAHIDDARTLLVTLRQGSSGHPLDPDHIIRGIFATAAETAEKLHEMACKTHEAAQEDHRFSGDDDMDQAFCDFIAALADYHNVLEDIREHIETHDALLEPPSGKVYDNPEALFADILARR